MRRLSLALLLMTSAATACRSVPAAPPAPDAVAIVEGTAGALVHTDTVADPFTVSIGEARWRPRSAAPKRGDFWSSVALLDVAAAGRSANSIEERTFVTALETLLQGKPEEAAVAFAALRGAAADPVLRARARVGLTMALSWNSDWPAIARLAAPADTADDVDPGQLREGVERWARAFAELPPAMIDIPDGDVVLPLRRSVFGTPVIEVRINGHPHRFWLDTGASMTLLSTDVAIQGGVRLASTDSLALGVVRGRVEARAILIDSLDIGPVRVRSLSAAVVTPDALRLDLRESRGVTREVPIDGVIGTDLLRHMDIVIDAGAETITLRRPRASEPAARNLFWVGFPVVRLVTRDGTTALFGLDTGAEGTYVTPALLRKLPHTPIAARRGSLGGLGTERQSTEFVAREVALSDGGRLITLRNAPVAPDHRWTFVDFDGMLGSDVALGSRLHLDFLNGVFDVRPSEGIPSPGIKVIRK